MDLKKTGSDIFHAIGGNDNITHMTHCATRLRFELKDFGKADKAAVKKLPGVLDVVEKGGQFQVVIGPDVQIAYHAADALFTGKSATQTEEPTKSSCPPH